MGDVDEQIQRCVWEKASNGNYPNRKFLVSAGIDKGDPLYVARAMYAGAVIPGKLQVSERCTYVTYSGQEIAMKEYEVLSAPAASLSWVKANNGHIPEDAVRGGQDVNGEPYYIGRVIYKGTLTTGKVHGSHDCCYVPYNGSEHKVSEYEVLVKNLLGKYLDV